MLRCAENFGFIELVDAAMLELVAHRLAVEPDVSIAVNASVGTIERNCGALVAAIFSHLQQADRLIVEITETVEVRDPRSVEIFMSGARAAGVSVAFDDFGDGHFSFEHILRFKPDIVKLAGAMLARPREFRRDISRLLSMAAAEGFAVVAENIDTEEKRQPALPQVARRRDSGIGSRPHDALVSAPAQRPVTDGRSPQFWGATWRPGARDDVMVLGNAGTA
nr:EAL domain-containing protein [Xanthomonas euvesicatoria]